MELTAASENVIKALAAKYAKSTPALGNDLHQEGYAAALENVHKHDPARCKQSTFIYVIAQRAMVAYLRAEMRATQGLVALEDLVLVDDEGEAEPTDDVIDRLTDLMHQNGAEDEIYLMQVMDRLTARQREAIELRLQGLDLHEIGDVMGITKQSVSELIRAGTLTMSED